LYCASRVSDNKLVSYCSQSGYCLICLATNKNYLSFVVISITFTTVLGDTQVGTDSEHLYHQAILKLIEIHTNRFCRVLPWKVCLCCPLKAWTLLSADPLCFTRREWKMWRWILYPPFYSPHCPWQPAINHFSPCFAYTSLYLFIPGYPSCSWHGNSFPTTSSSNHFLFFSCPISYF